MTHLPRWTAAVLGSALLASPVMAADAWAELEADVATFNAKFTPD